MKIAYIAPSNTLSIQSEDANDIVTIGRLSAKFDTEVQTPKDQVKQTEICVERLLVFAANAPMGSRRY